MEKLKGIIPVLVSPVHKDGTLDEKGYHGLLDYTMQHPIAGYWMLGSASEDFMMSFEQRVKAVKVVSEHVGGRLPIIAGCSFGAWDDICRFFDATADFQIAAYHLLPVDRRMGVLLATKFLTMAAERAPRPLWLYNNGMRALPVPVEAVDELRHHPKIAGIKAAGFDLMDILPFCRMQTDSFQTIGSGGGHIMLFLAMGCTAHTVSSGCAFPRQYCEIYQLWEDGKREEALALSNKMVSLSKRLPNPANTELSAMEKLLLEIYGVCERWVYEPFFACTDDDKRKAEGELRKAGML